MRVTLVVPGLAAAAKASAQCRGALARLMDFADSQTLAGDLDCALLADAGLGADAAVAPIAALGAGFHPGSAYVLRADPVALVAGRDNVLLAGRVDDLARDEASGLCATLAAHFAGDGVAFHLPRPDAWFLTAKANVPVDTAPLAAITGPIQPFLPRGPHGATWRRWLSEMQMLLHGHAVNAAREAQGRLPVTGIWIASGGSLPHEAPAFSAQVYAAAGAAGDAARGLASFARQPIHALPGSFAALADGAASGGDAGRRGAAWRGGGVGRRGDADRGRHAEHDDGGDRGGDAAIVVLDPIDTGDDDSVTRLARDWLDPAAAALARGTLDTLVVIGDGSDGVQRWSAVPPSLIARLRARLRRPPRTS